MSCHGCSASCSWESACTSSLRAARRPRTAVRASLSRSIASGVQALEQVGHLERGECRFRALVAGLAAGAVDRLFEGFAGQHAEADRYARLERGARDARGALAGDEIEVRGLTLDD